jgi:hypothetical protein
LTDRI